MTINSAAYNLGIQAFSLCATKRTAGMQWGRVSLPSSAKAQHEDTRSGVSEGRM